MKLSGVYAIIHRQSGRTYVGSSCNIFSRWRGHLAGLSQGRHHTSALLDLWLLDGPSAFAFVVLEQCPREVLADREQEWLDSFYQPLNTSTSTRSPMLDPKVRTKVSISRTGYKVPADQREKMKARAARQVALGFTPPHGKEWSAKVHASKMGHLVSEATRAKIRAASVARLAMPGAREALSAAVRAGWANKPASRARMSEATKAWQASRNPEEKRIALSRASVAGWTDPATRLRRAVSHSLAMARPETKAAVGTASRRWWAAQSSEERSERMRTVRAGSGAIPFRASEESD